MATTLAPGAWIGIVGGGQLGRMLAMEATRMGYRVCVLDPDPECPASHVVDRLIQYAYDDPDGAKALAEQAEVITYEFENVDVRAVRLMEEIRPVNPSADVLYIKQSRLREKDALTKAGLAVAPYVAVTNEQELGAAVERLGLPLVLKAAMGGYDGKGQWMLSSEEDAATAMAEITKAAGGEPPLLVAEQYVRFAKELSVICARAKDGAVACYPVVENVHTGGILDTTTAPANVAEAVAEEARSIAVRIAEALDITGLVAVELFLTGDGRLLVNEIAPRPHNSGHYTLDACAISQFEQLVRVLCNQPLGDTGLLTPAVMVNLLGDLWVEADGEPDFSEAFRLPSVKLHLYGKAEARRGRKMGHITAVAQSVEVAGERARQARDGMVGRAKRL